MARDLADLSVQEAIEGARSSGAKTLRLSGFSPPLTTLPDSLSELTSLRSLDLSRNQLVSIPQSLLQLPELQSLDLSNNRLTALPESICQLTQLKSLYLSSNLLQALPNSLGQLSRLQSLMLSNNQLQDLPKSIGQLSQLRSLDVAHNQLTALPPSLGDLAELLGLTAQGNRLTDLPESLAELKNLRLLELGNNAIRKVPAAVGHMRLLETLGVSGNALEAIPEWLVRLSCLQSLVLGENELRDLPVSLAAREGLQITGLDMNPVTPEYAAAAKEGVQALRRYAQAKAGEQVVLNEAKLILVGEGDVGKSSLLGALRGDDWVEGRVTTHGIEIKPLKVTDSSTGAQITLNGWDFGGQRVYRPTHQLFFSAPAVYLVVWKPREGPQQGFVKEWIRLVKHREPEARVIVVATHGGPRDRQPDIDRQEIWDLFGKQMIAGFHHVQSEPPVRDVTTGKRTGTGLGIADLRAAIARVAVDLDDVGRSVPKRWQQAREALRKSNEAYLALQSVFAIFSQHEVHADEARVLLRICHRVGDVIHYETDPLLKDIVIIRPDWLATAISFVLDDPYTRELGRGLVTFKRLSQLWNDDTRPVEHRYPPALHEIFLRLMERFDLSYRVAEAGPALDQKTSLIAQLVPDVRPEDVHGWLPRPAAGDVEQQQVCRIVDSASNQSAAAEGLFYQLIVRLHKYSLGRSDYAQSSHWQRGLVLEDHTGARAFLEQVTNDVRITVRSPYPERFLAALTYEVKWLVEDFWRGMRCEVTVPCFTRLPNGEACKGLFEVAKLIENKKRGREEQPCPICNDWHGIEALLRNAPDAGPNPLKELQANFVEVKNTLNALFVQVGSQHADVIGRFDNVDAASREVISKVEAAYSGLMRSLLDEAREGPRLFSFEPEEPGFLGKPKWVSAKVKVTLWCEHARVPLWKIADDPTTGVYTLDLPRAWFVRAAPYLKVLSTTLSLLLPVVAAVPKVALTDSDFKQIEGQLALGKSTSEALLKGGDQMGEWMGEDDGLEMTVGSAARAEGAVLRQLHAWLKEKDVGFGGLVRVQNRRQEFLWVHAQFAKEY